MSGFDLGHDLAFAQDHAVEASCYAQEMQDGIVAQELKVWSESAVVADRLYGGKKGFDSFEAAIDVIDYRVDFGAIAGREDGCFFYAGKVLEAGQSMSDTRIRDGKSFPDGDRARVIIDSADD